MKRLFVSHLLSFCKDVFTSTPWAGPRVKMTGLTNDPDLEDVSEWSGNRKQLTTHPYLHVSLRKSLLAPLYKRENQRSGGLLTCQPAELGSNLGLLPWNPGFFSPAFS